MSSYADCERDDGWLGQDVNAWSSLGYVAVGAVLLVAVLRRRIVAAIAALGALAIIEGAGSVLYHGVGGAVAQALHDLALAGMLGFIAGWQVGRSVAPSVRAASTGALAGAALALALNAAIEPVASGVTNVSVGVLAALVVVSELLARRRGADPIWTAGPCALTVIALATWWAGSASSPLCDADSVVQPHGAWHLLTALLALVWADRASAVLTPDRPPRLMRHATDWLIGWLAWWIVHAFHRSVDVLHRERLRPGRATLVVANHGNGFVDPVLIAGAFRRLPRFIAKAALFKLAVARPALAGAGVLPIYRSGDGDDARGNAGVFHACERELGLGGTVAIFPEGTTGDRGGLDRIRSGAARIALASLPDAPDLEVVPIGLAFESRVRVRTRALVIVGEPIPVADFEHGVASGDEALDRADVAALTDAIAGALAAISPDYASVWQRDLYRGAADAVLSAGTDTPRFGEIELLARQIAAAPAPVRTRVEQAFMRFTTRLHLAGLDAHDLGARHPGRLRLLAALAALALVHGLLLTVALVYLPVILLAALASAVVRSTATKGTVRILVGAAGAVATWIVAGIVLADGAAAFVAGLAVAVAGILALAVWTPLAAALSATWRGLRVRSRAGLLPPVLADRDELAAAVQDATGGDDD